MMGSLIAACDDLNANPAHAPIARADRQDIPRVRRPAIGYPPGKRFICPWGKPCLRESAEGHRGLLNGVITPLADPATAR